MRLDEAKTPEQLRKAYAAGDRELRRDIEKALSDAIYRAFQYVDYEDREWLVTHDSLLGERGTLDLDELERLLAAEGTDVDGLGPQLQSLGSEATQEYLKDEVITAVDNFHSDRSFEHSRDLLRIGYHHHGGCPGNGMVIGHQYFNLHLTLDEPLVWLKSSDITRELAEASHFSQDDDAGWDALGEGSFGSGWIKDEDQTICLVLNRNATQEWITDKYREWLSDFVDADESIAIAELWRQVKLADPKLYKKMKKAKLPDEVLASYAVAFFENPDEGIVILREAMGSFGYEGTRGDLLLELDRPALQAMGITEGRWWDGAPWKLMNLPPAELAYEGTLQRHCVGRHDMGYREAVMSGETQVWSLRNRFHKPVLTWEIDTTAWEDSSLGGASSPMYRARAVAQLKGKLNRTAGKDLEESRVLYWIFAKLGIDPNFVRDFEPFVHAWPDTLEDNPGFDAPWSPYRSRCTARLLR